MTDSGSGPRLYSQQSTKTSVRRNVSGQPTSVKSTTTSRTLPAQSRQFRSEVKKFSSSSSGSRSLPGVSATTTRTSSTRVASRSGGSGGSGARTVKTSTRTFSAGRRH